MLREDPFIVSLLDQVRELLDYIIDVASQVRHPNEIANILKSTSRERAVLRDQLYNYVRKVSQRKAELAMIAACKSHGLGPDMLLGYLIRLARTDAQGLPQIDVAREIFELRAICSPMPNYEDPLAAVVVAALDGCSEHWHVTRNGVFSVYDWDFGDRLTWRDFFPTLRHDCVAMRVMLCCLKHGHFSWFYRRDGDKRGVRRIFSFLTGF